ncbi:PREDICTED: C-Myc-binding protein homolog [Nicrophorus vespilloides]|uniref:c-Myc-binding protein homolog n=1 Tax=Nicrophorus vespilloides TaxID=110193 RepID=A0ABM1MA52_NICVS|nr:PREDICTED: C-Myc-binding protein homolog [Nicrophorus vespilloides]
MAANPTYKPNECKREEFRRYLEKTGVMDALTKVLVLLYEETDKPDDALLFIQNTLAKQTGNETLDELKAQIAELQEKITMLEEEKEKGHVDENADAGEAVDGEAPASSPSAAAAASQMAAAEPAAEPAPAE